MATFKIIPRPQFFYHILSRLITPYHTLSPRLEAKLFSFGNFKISSQSPNFLSQLISPSHTFSHLLTPYPLVWKQNHLMLATFKSVPRPRFFITSYHPLSLLITPNHTLSPRLEAKLFSFGTFKISSQSPNFLSQLITPSHIWSHIITPYLLAWKQNHLMLGNFKLVPRSLFSYHILSRLVTPYHTLSHLIP